MTLVDQHVPALTWTEPEGIACRGTLVVLPGRGEPPTHYERFGRRVAADGYRVCAMADPTADLAVRSGLRRGALYEPVPDGWAEADLGAVPQPILGLHGTDDPISSLAAVRVMYAAATTAELVSVADGTTKPGR